MRRALLGATRRRLTLKLNRKVGPGGYRWGRGPSGDAWCTKPESFAGHFDYR